MAATRNFHPFSSRQPRRRFLLQGIIATTLHVLTLVPVCYGAGMTTHNVAARRASQYEYFGPSSSTFQPAAFEGLAAARADAIQAGAPFPDYLYACTFLSD